MPYNVFRNVEQIHFRGRVFGADEIDFFNGVRAHANDALGLASKRGYSGPTRLSDYKPGDKCRHCIYSGERCSYEGSPDVLLMVEHGEDGRIGKRKSCIIDEAAVEALVESGFLDRYELEPAS